LPKGGAGEKRGRTGNAISLTELNLWTFYGTFFVPAVNLYGFSAPVFFTIEPTGKVHLQLVVSFGSYSDVNSEITVTGYLVDAMNQRRGVDDRILSSALIHSRYFTTFRNMTPQDSCLLCVLCPLCVFARNNSS
jgi:hypothetical protein